MQRFGAEEAEAGVQAEGGNVGCFGFDGYLFETELCQLLYTELVEIMGEQTSSAPSAWKASMAFRTSCLAIPRPRWLEATQSIPM